MNRALILGFLVLSAAAATRLAEAAVPQGRLVWENGDVLTGAVVAADEGKLTWNSPVFSGPFSLDIARLKSIHFAAEGETLNSSEPLRFATYSGDVIYGKLAGLTDEHVVVDSGRHGRVQILRSALRSFGRIDPRALEDTSPPNTSGWRALSTTQTIAHWRADAAGRLSTQILDAELGGDFKLPEIAEFDLALSWKNDPAFIITFGSVRAVRFGGDVVKLTVEDDRLALIEAGDTRARPLLALTGDRVRLRFLWNRASEDLTIFTAEGDPLAQTKIGAAAGTGMHIKNRGRDLTVEHLRMRASTGAVLRELASGEAHVRLFDGTSFSGRLAGMDRSGELVIDDPVAGRRRVATANLVSVHFMNAAFEQAAPSQVKVRYYDGTLLAGTLVSAADERLKLQTSFCREPIASKLTGVREILFLSERRLPRPTDLDILEIGGEGGGILHGNLAAVESAGGALGWRPVGSDAASPFALTNPVRFVRRANRDEANVAARNTGGPRPINPFVTANADARGGADDQADEPASDVLYLDNGDMILCRIQTIDEVEATVTSDLFDTQKIPTGRIRAIEFNSESFVPFAGFQGEEWVVTEREKDAVTITNDTVAFRGQATLGHNGLLQGDELQFDVLWNPTTRCVLTINLYANDARRSDGIPLMLYFMEQNLLVRGPNARGFIQHAPAEVRMLGGARNALQLGGVGGVAVGLAPQAQAQQEQVQQALQRLRQATADRIRALEAQQRKPLNDDQQLRIQEQLATLVQRQAAVEQQMKAAAEAQAEQERVAAAAAQQPPMPEENLRRATIRFVHKGRSLEINIDKSQSFSQPVAAQDDLAGKGIQFTVQPVAVRRVRVVDANGRIQQIDPEPQDEDLLKITNLVVSRSGNAMRFLRIDDDQRQSVLTIPRSRRNNPPTHLLVAQNGDLLRGQLVSATKEKIQFRSRMDALTLDRARVAAIVALSREAEEGLDAEAGEVVADVPEVPADDAQTVRVVLSDGTRLTFAMQEGMKETLVGEHPLLGACSILVDHVHELQAGGQVRTWPNDFAYDEWKLVSAKEPIFPDMGAGGAMPGLGSDSPLVGTQAEDFVVPLAGGGRFRLAEHTDKIVVLDFWATWCGPCAVALPKIVEATGQFPTEDVIFIAVNQQETEVAIRDYLTAREWDFTVALDRDGAIGRQFHVEAIPQTVVIGKGGKIERVHIGAHPNLQEELQTVLQELLTPPAEEAAAAESN